MKRMLISIFPCYVKRETKKGGGGEEEGENGVLLVAKVSGRWK